MCYGARCHQCSECSFLKSLFLPAHFKALLNFDSDNRPTESGQHNCSGSPIHTLSSDFEHSRWSPQRRGPACNGRWGEWRVPGSGSRAPGPSLAAVILAQKLCAPATLQSGSAVYHRCGLGGHIHVVLLWPIQHCPLLRESPAPPGPSACTDSRSEEHTSELQSLRHLVCR